MNCILVEFNWIYDGIDALSRRRRTLVKTFPFFYYTQSYPWFVGFQRIGPWNLKNGLAKLLNLDLTDLPSIFLFFPFFVVVNNKFDYLLERVLFDYFGIGVAKGEQKDIQFVDWPVWIIDFFLNILIYEFVYILRNVPFLRVFANLMYTPYNLMTSSRDSWKINLYFDCRNLKTRKGK